MNVNLIDFFFNLSLSLWILPSGTILGIPIKSIVYIITFCLLIGLKIKKNNMSFSKQDIIIIITTLISVIFWSLLGIANGYSYSTGKELVSFFSLLIVILLVLLYVREYTLDDKLNRVKKILYSTAIIYVLFKILLEILYVTKIIDYAQIMYVFKDILNSQITSFPFDFFGIIFCRLQTSNDSIPLVFLSYFLICENRPLFHKIVVIVVSLIFSMIVYSRVIFFQIFIIIIIGIIKEIELKKKIKKKSIAFALILAFAIFILIENIQISFQMGELLSMRFSGTLVAFSDNIREDELLILSNGFWESPFIGRGLGAYIRGFIRLQLHPYSYELEYLSFLYQFGIFGFIAIVIPIIYVAYKNSVGILHRGIAKFITLVNFLIWLLKPIFNPNFLSSSSGMLISILIIFANTYIKSNYSNEEK